MVREVTKDEKGKEGTSDKQEDKRKVVTMLKDQFMFDIGYKTMFEEVYKNQLKIIEDKERESKQKKLEDQASKQRDY